MQKKKYFNFGVVDEYSTNEQFYIRNPIVLWTNIDICFLYQQYMPVFCQQKIAYYTCVRGQRLNEQFQQFYDSMYTLT